MKTPAAGAVGVETHLSSLPAPATSWRRRRRRWGWRRWHSPVMRGRWRWRRHPPSVAVVMVALDVATWDVASRLRHCDACECDYGEDRNEFYLVHVVVPFFVCGCEFAVRLKLRSARRQDRRGARRRFRTSHPCGACCCGGDGVSAHDALPEAEEARHGALPRAGVPGARALCVFSPALSPVPLRCVWPESGLSPHETYAREPSSPWAHSLWAECFL